jgi:alginate O-acetyltransferase complex protein AlgJ
MVLPRMVAALSIPFKKSLGAVSLALLACSLLLACRQEEPGSAEPEVLTLNPGYDRLGSAALARRVRVPTEANLDFAAYSKNVMLADPESKSVQPKARIRLDDLLFGNLVEETKAILDFTPLTEAEKSRPMAWAPVLERLLSWNFERTAPLANAYSAVTAEKWGDTSDVSGAYQEFASLYIHSRGNVKEAWVELEFKPWMGSHLDGIQDRDQDRHPEVLARLNPELFTPAMAEFLLGDYSTKVLAEPAVMDWARNLASRWYPSYNTDFADIRPGMPWPQEGSSAAVREAMGGATVSNPLFAFRGRPFEDTLYNVFEVDGMGAAKSAEAKRREGAPVARGIDAGLTARLDAISARIDQDVKEHGGGSWETWASRLGPFHETVRRFASREPASIQGLMARDGYLVFRRELDYLLAPDWASPAAKHDPLPVITALKDRLAAQGIDFLFVPIPTKQDVYPEILFDGDGAATAGRPGGHPALPGGGHPALPGGIAQPHLRKVLKDLAEARVETVDLLDPFLRLKAASEPGKRLLYQKQDTHWSTVGLETAAQVLADRIRNYTWFDSAFAARRDWLFADTTFESLGDIQARLSDAAKAKVGPEVLEGRRVKDREGNLYQDSDSSAVLVLGDSYTGVYHTVGCRNAGVTAHLAARLGAPVDLVMGWGGGPEAPQKLARRGDGYLADKRLVVWMMSARDLFAYPGDWAPAKAGSQSDP